MQNVHKEKKVGNKVGNKKNESAYGTAMA